jgi:hypothetical protein
MTGVLPDELELDELELDELELLLLDDELLDELLDDELDDAPLELDEPPPHPLKPDRTIAILRLILMVIARSALR